MTAPYRPTPEQARDARVVEAELHVRSGGRLPRICIVCGTKKSLVEETHAHEWRPGAAPLLRVFGILGQAVEGSLARTAHLTYSTCKACARRARDQQDIMKGVIFAALVVLLVAATVGLNGYPIPGAAIVVVGAGVFALLAVEDRRDAAGNEIVEDDEDDDDDENEQDESEDTVDAAGRQA